MIKVSQVNSENVGYSSDVFNQLMLKVFDLVNPHLDNKEVLSLVWVDDVKIQELNKQYRGKDTPTDVLSFSYLDDEQNESLGEIVVSIDTMAKQAKEYNHELELEAKILFVHGLLHILGYDHETKEDLSEMLDLEQKVLGDNAGLIKRAEFEQK